MIYYFLMSLIFVVIIFMTLSEEIDYKRTVQYLVVLKLVGECVIFLLCLVCLMEDTAKEVFLLKPNLPIRIFLTIYNLIYILWFFAEIVDYYDPANEKFYIPMFIVFPFLVLSLFLPNTHAVNIFLILFGVETVLIGIRIAKGRKI